MRLQPEQLLSRLVRAYGPQRWWPARTRFEVMVGAVLVQNTAWANVERAIDRLRARQWLTAEAIDTVPESALAVAIRPAGTYRVKARRLQALSRWFLAQGGFPGLRARSPALLREALLAVHGIGPETASAILLYALGHPVFVVDAYTRRLFGRLGVLPPGQADEALRAQVEARPWGRPAQDLGELHALIVEHCKRACRPRPRCGECPVRDVCCHASAAG